MWSYFLAIGLPVLLMVVGTRITYSVIGSLIVTFMIMVFAVQVHQMNWLAMTFAAVSFISGVRIAMNMKKRIG
ncbi:MAG: CsbA family protein [Bacillaceae bacterium]|nr:CsbA family protein [Bacillaceae bacterium]